MGLKRNHICILGLPGGEEKKGTEDFFKELIAENHFNLDGELDSHPGGLKSSKQINSRLTSLKQLIIKLLKASDKYKILTTLRKKKGSLSGNTN